MQADLLFFLIHVVFDGRFKQETVRLQFRRTSDDYSGLTSSGPPDL
jgi:hypothetical protein